MATLNYKVPIESAVTPRERVGPPAYNPVGLHYMQGTNKDWWEARFVDTEDEDLLISLPVPSGYSGGGATINLRFTSDVAAGTVRFDILDEDGGAAGEVWDEAISNGPATVSGAVAGVVGQTAVLSVALAGGAGWTAGKVLTVRITRNNSVGGNAAGYAALTSIEVDFTVAGAAITLAGVNEEVRESTEFTYSAPISEMTLTASVLADVAWNGLRQLFFDGTKEDTSGNTFKHVAGIPAASGEWRINGSTLQVHGDHTAAGTDVHVVYPV